MKDAPPFLAPEVRELLEARGLNPDQVYADLLEDVRTPGGYVPSKRYREGIRRSPARLPLAWVLAPGDPKPF